MSIRSVTPEELDLRANEMEDLVPTETEWENVSKAIDECISIQNGENGDTVTKLLVASKKFMNLGMANNFPIFGTNNKDPICLVFMINLNNQIIVLLKDLFKGAREGKSLTAKTNSEAAEYRKYSKQLKGPLQEMHTVVSKVIVRLKKNVDWEIFLDHQPKEILGVHLLPQTIYSQEAINILMKEMR